MERFVIDNYQELLIEEGNLKIISKGRALNTKPENLHKYYVRFAATIASLQNCKLLYTKKP